MANRNICDVDTLSTMSENTNVIVEENGVLNKLNLQNEIDNKINTHLEQIANQIADQEKNPLYGKKRYF